MIKKLAESIKQPISFNRIANIVSTTGSKLSTTSAIKYVEYAESAWLLQRINNIAAKLAEKESNSKYYFTDNGILNLFLIDGNTSLLENLVAISLIRQFGKEDAVFLYKRLGNQGTGNGCINKTVQGIALQTVSRYHFR